MNNIKKNESDTFVWMIIGALGAVILGGFLIPLRQVTSASNLAFIFLLFTIIVAELGGRGPALMTAVLSAISLNFFLTQPYLTLTIHHRDDIIAFFALVVSGLVAAAFGKKRAQWSEAAKRATERLDSLTILINRLQKKRPLEEILSELQQQFGLGAIVIRDEKENIIAAAPTDSSHLVPEIELNSASLFPKEEKIHRYGEHGFRLPEGGGRLTFKTDRGSFAFDLWEGDTRGLDIEMRQTLAIAALILVLELSFQVKQ